MRNKQMIFIGGLLTILIIGSIGGYLAYQYYAEPIEPEPELKLIDTIDLTYSEWNIYKQTGYAKFSINEALTNIEGKEIVQLYDSNPNYRAKGDLSFYPIKIGKMKLRMKIFSVAWNMGCWIRFMSSGKTVFSIIRDNGGTWLFSIDDVFINLIQSSETWKTWLIDWEIGDGNMNVSIVIDNTMELDNYQIRTQYPSIDQIKMFTQYNTDNSWTVFSFEESYLKSYILE